MAPKPRALRRLDRAHASRTAPVSRSSIEAASGRQRLQGRKPARSASSAAWKKRTFSRRGSRAGQPGRQ
jgi:hypothetical protein